MICIDVYYSMPRFFLLPSLYLPFPPFTFLSLPLLAYTHTSTPVMSLAPTCCWPETAGTQRFCPMQNCAATTNPVATTGLKCRHRQLSSHPRPFGTYHHQYLSSHRQHLLAITIVISVLADDIFFRDHHRRHHPPSLTASALCRR